MLILISDKSCIGSIKRWSNMNLFLKSVALSAMAFFALSAVMVSSQASTLEDCGMTASCVDGNSSETKGKIGHTSSSRSDSVSDSSSDNETADNDSSDDDNSADDSSDDDSSDDNNSDADSSSSHSSESHSSHDSGSEGGSDKGDDD